MGAINSGKTICGVLFGASIHLGFLNGIDSTDAPKLKDEGRLKAIYDENDGKFAAYNRFTDLSKLKNIEIDLDTVSSCVHEYRRQIKPDNPRQNFIIYTAKIYCGIFLSLQIHA